MIARAHVNWGAAARRVVDAVLEDLADRRGIGERLGAIAPEVLAELRDDLAARVAAVLEPGLAGAELRRAAGRAAMADVQAELDRIIDRIPPYASAHEGWAVIREELGELWLHVAGNTGYSEAAYEEAVQVAATAARYAAELCREGRP